MTSATDRNVDALISAVFGAEGITACQDALSYDTRLQRVQESILPTVSSKLRQYFDAEVEPLLRSNMEVGCAGWTNNACESVNHVLKQRTQWRITHLPDLISKCRSLVDAQFKEADRALVGLGDFTLHPTHTHHRQTLSRWQAMSDRQQQRVIRNCFKLQLPVDTSASTDGNLTVTYRQTAGKKLNQRKRPRAERVRTME